MATRIIEKAPKPSQRTQDHRPGRRRHQAITENLTGTSMLNHTAGLFGLVREELLVEAAPTRALALRETQALALQRCMDVALATLCLLILWPVMLAAAILVRLSSPGPVFYSQPRIGRNGEIFGCLKFRTMQVDADRLLQELLESSPAIHEMWKQEQKLLDDPRITFFGCFLRRYSIDELPQLFNVLRGDMSIVGPRPIVDAEIQRYAGNFGDYCLVKPGLTGLWQVSGRNLLSYRRRVELDCHYVRTRSLRGDVWIILRTIPVVLRGTGY